jgi:hypothetical protein
MTGLLLYAAKRAVIDLLTRQVAGSDVKVSYQAPKDWPDTAVYGGAVRSTRADLVAEPGVVMEETVTVDVWLRCYADGGDQQAVDLAAEQQAQRIIRAIDARARGDLTTDDNPDGLRFASVTIADGGTPANVPGTAQSPPGVIAKLLLQVEVSGTV